MYISLADGQALNFSIPRSSVTHFLGVSSEKLQQLELIKLYSWECGDDYDPKDSYSGLRRLIQFRSKVLADLNSVRPSVKYEELFSKDIERKLDGFISNLMISPYTINWVCKYDKRIAAFYNGQDKILPFDYIVKQSNDSGEIFLLGLRHSSKDPSIVVPVSNQYFSGVSDFNYAIKETEMLQGQQITFANCSCVSSDNKIYLPPHAKTEKIQKLKETTSRVKATLINSHGNDDISGVPVINIVNEYEWVMNKHEESIKKRTIQNALSFCNFNK